MNQVVAVVEVGWQPILIRITKTQVTQVGLNILPDMFISILASILIQRHIIYRHIATGPGTNSISETDDDDLNDSDLDDDDEDVDVDGIDEQDPEGVEHEIIDIREPLINLKRKLEVKLEIDLTHYDFYLQGTQIENLN